MDHVPSCSLAHCKYQSFSRASTNETSSKKERIRVFNMLLYAVRRYLLDIIGTILIHGLIASDVHAFDQHAISWDPHSRLDDDQVPDDYLRDRACL